jgi:hypothetical protein
LSAYATKIGRSLILAQKSKGEAIMFCWKSVGLVRFLLVVGVPLILSILILVPRPEAQAEPMPISECRNPIEVTGSYVLTNNLFAQGNCLSATVAPVTIDLAGFEIFGDGSGIGISIPQVNSVVRNGTVRNFDQGVSASVVENVGVFGTKSTGIAASDRAKNNVVIANSGDGLIATGVIIENTVVGNGGIGIRVLGQSIVINNNVLQNHIGLQSLMGGSTVMNNVVSGNEVDGIALQCPAVVAFNTATNNHPDFFIRGNCTLTGNRSGSF